MFYKYHFEPSKTIDITFNFQLMDLGVLVCFRKIRNQTRKYSEL